VKIVISPAGPGSACIRAPRPRCCIATARAYPPGEAAHVFDATQTSFAQESSAFVYGHGGERVRQASTRTGVMGMKGLRLGRHALMHDGARPPTMDERCDDPLVSMEMFR